MQVTAPCVALSTLSDGRSVADEARLQRRRIWRMPFGRKGALFTVFLVLTFVNFAAWSLATPLFASPDEPTQVARAAAAVRGELVGFTIDGPASAYTAVHVPKIFDSGTTSVVCYKFHPTVPASCSPPLTTSTETVHVATYVGRYPPLYYLIVGLPSLIFVSKTGIYLMRLMSSLLNALLISIALLAVVVWSRRRLLLIGVMVATTPMAWFIGGMVNPSGFEICAGILLWTSGLILVLDHPDRPPPRLVALVAVATCLLSLARPISLLWVAITLVVLSLLGGRRAILGVLSSRAARWSALPVAACGAFALWWVNAEHSLDLLPGSPAAPGESTLQLLATALDHAKSWPQQMVGVFGWKDTPSPLLTYVVWLAIIVVLLLLAMSCAGASRAGALSLLVVVVIVLPIVLDYAVEHRLGIDAQGRYWLPIAVGVPLVCVALVDGSTKLAWFRTWAPSVLAAGIGAGSIAAFLEALRRYAVGVTGPIDFLVGKWHPPVGLLGAAVGGSVCIVLLLTTVVMGSGRVVAEPHGLRAVRSRGTYPLDPDAPAEPREPEEVLIAVEHGPSVEV